MSTLKPGVWGVLPTPFQTGTLAVDHRSLTAVVDRYGSLAEDGPVAGLVALGVFGEAARLTADERDQVLQTVVNAGPLEVVAGIAVVDPKSASEEAARLADAARGRLRAVMVQISSAEPTELTKNLTAVHDACGLPIVVQDYPISSGIRIAADTLAEVVNTLPFVAAVKCESSPTSAAIAQLASALPAVPIFGGLGGIGLLDELGAGAAGAMTGFSYPEALLSVVNAWSDGGFAAARAAIAPWLPLMNFEGQAEIGLALRKEHLRRRGWIESATVRPPARGLPAELVGLLEKHLATVPTGSIPSSQPAGRAALASNVPDSVSRSCHGSSNRSG